MKFAAILHNISRVMFVGALAVFALAALELAAGLIGVSLIGNAYAAGRLFEMGAALLVPVIAITLREIRETLQTKE